MKHQKLSALRHDALKETRVATVKAWIMATLCRWLGHNWIGRVWVTEDLRWSCRRCGVQVEPDWTWEIWHLNRIQIAETWGRR